MTHQLPRTPNRSHIYVALMVALSALCFVGLEIVHSLISRDEAIDQAYTSAENLSASLSVQTASSLDLVAALLQELADRQATMPSKAEVESLRPLLISRLASFGSINGLFILDEAGAALVTSLPDPQAVLNFGDRAYFDYHRRHGDIGLHIGEPVESRISGRWVIPVSRRLNRPDGRFAGVVLASIAVDHLRQIYDRFEIGSQGAIKLVRDDGVILARKPFDSRWLGKNLSAYAEFRPILAERASGRMEIASPLDGVRRLLAFRRIEGYPLIVVVALSSESAMANWRDEYIPALGLEGAAAAVLLAVGLLLARQMRQNASHDEGVARSERSYRLLADSASDLVLTVDSECRTTYASPSSFDVLGLESECLIGRMLPDLAVESDSETLRHAIRSAEQSGRTHTSAGLRHHRGHPVWLDMAIRRLPEERGFVIAAHDISERRDLETRLQEAGRILDVRRQKIDLIGRLARRLPCCRDNAEFAETIRCYLPQILPETAGAFYLLEAGATELRRLSNWGQGGFAERFKAEDCWALRRGQRHSVEDANSETICAHHGPLPCPYVCTPLVAQEKIVGMLHLRYDAPPDDRDLDMVVETISLALVNLLLQQDLRDKSMRDALTGLFNRRQLETALEAEVAKALRDGTSLSLLMLDADHFKRLNDTHGHEAGDHVLIEIARMLESHFRDSDIACRFGGEEFVVIMPGTGRAPALARAEALRAAVAGRSFVFEGRSIGAVTLSVGVATLPENGEAPEALLSKADQALYAAKRGGRNQVVMATEGDLSPLSVAR